MNEATKIFVSSIVDEVKTKAEESYTKEAEKLQKQLDKFARNRVKYISSHIEDELRTKLQALVDNDLAEIDEINEVLITHGMSPVIRSGRSQSDYSCGRSTSRCSCSTN